MTKIKEAQFITTKMHYGLHWDSFDSYICLQWITEGTKASVMAR